MDFLTEIKKRLKISDDTQDEYLVSLINQTGQEMLNYCCIQALPQQLFYVLLSAVVAYQTAMFDEDGKNIGNLKSRSLEEGGVKYAESYNDSSGQNGVRGILSGYIAQLNRYKKVGGSPGLFLYPVEEDTP